MMHDDRESNGGSGEAREPELTEEERATYAWQMWVPGVGEAGQRRLRGSSVLVSRVGGLGGVVAYELAAAGVGRLTLAHSGVIKPSDLNRQLLMTHDAVGTSRVESAARRLRELNPRLVVDAVPENVSEANAERLVGSVDVVVDAAPLFAERFALNREAFRQGKPMVEAAMYELEATLTTFMPGRTPCLACLYPEEPADWRREFPVFGAVSGTVGCMAAVEVIKLLTGIREPLLGRLFWIDLGSVRSRVLKIARAPECPVCGGRG
jgi:molybdopterin/thiamine biosynthesis adenylyltransferase